MSENIKLFFMLFGVAVTAGLLIGLFLCGISLIKERIERRIRHYKIKHRFDKPPTAKCYCKDCERHSADGRCRKFNGWYTGDSWFCWDAEPRKEATHDDA